MFTLVPTASPWAGIAALLMMDPRIQPRSPRAALKYNPNSMAAHIAFVQPPLPNSRVVLWFSPGEEGREKKWDWRRKRKCISKVMPVLKSKMGDMGREKKTMGLYHVLAGSADFLLELFRACLVYRSLLVTWSCFGRCNARLRYPYRSLTAPANLFLFPLWMTLRWGQKKIEKMKKKTQKNPTPLISWKGHILLSTKQQ